MELSFLFELLVKLIGIFVFVSGDADDLIVTDKENNFLKKWKDTASLNLLNLTYDVTPPDLVTAVVTELAILPCTSIPVVVRVKHTETGF